MEKPLDNYVINNSLRVLETFLSLTSQFNTKANEKEHYIHSVYNNFRPKSHIDFYNLHPSSAVLCHEHTDIGVTTHTQDCLFTNTSILNLTRICVIQT
jgi:hypothetical protein